MTAIGALEGTAKPFCSYDWSDAMKRFILALLFVAGVLTLAGC
jgi:hypothetical protein